MNQLRQIHLALLVFFMGACAPLVTHAQTDKVEAAPDSTKESTNNAADRLRSDQRAILDNYSELEQLLLQMAEYLGAEDPHRAALLRKAYQLSSENSTRQRLDELVTLLAKDGRASTLRSASKSQQQVQTDLESLLKLLLSENRAKRNEEEQKRIRKYLERVNKVIRKQRAISDQTQRGDEPKKQADKQGDLADETNKLGGELADDPATKPVDGDASEAKKPTKPSADKPMGGEQSQPKDSKPGDGQPSEKPPMPGDSPPSDEKPVDAESGPTADEPQLTEEPKQNPAEKQLKAAEQKMREAQKDLEVARREGALEKQQDALRRLEQAKAELERILRQLRLEEDQQQLELLESRFQAILKLQRKVYEATVRLDRVPQAERDADDEIEASRLARSQNEIIADVDKALLLLHEEGSAVAMTEVVTQMRDDMLQVAARLAKEQTDELTQGIEQDVLAALEEILAALDKAMKDSQQRRQSGQAPPGMPQDPPLVGVIAELKMLRSMQSRVRRRTEHYNKVLGEKTEQATQPELVESLKHLADRQSRISQATRDMAAGKNQ